MKVRFGYEDLELRTLAQRRSDLKLVAKTLELDASQRRVIDRMITSVYQDLTDVLRIVERQKEVQRQVNHAVSRTVRSIQARRDKKKGRPGNG